MTKLMRGVHDIRAAIETYMSVAVPAKIMIARTQWSLHPNFLPLPKRYDSYDPLTANEYPIVGSLVPRIRMSGRQDWDEEGMEVYRNNYSTRVFIWTQTPRDPITDQYVAAPYEATLRVRDDLVACLRAALLEDLSLGTTLNNDVELQVQEGTLSEEYFDAMKKSDQTSTWFAGGSIAFDMEVVESQYSTPHGTADTITTAVGHLDTNP